jgi:hypothetical protein
MADERSIDIGELQGGTYLVEIASRTGRYAGKIVKR